jgi:hypothetical protein
MADPEESNEEATPSRAPTRLDKALKLSRQVMWIVMSFSTMWLLWTFCKFFQFAPDLTTALLIGGILAAAFIIWIPKLQVSRVIFLTNAEKFGAENEARKTVATFVGGVAILMSFYTAQQQLGVQQQAQFTDRYTKAIDQIAATDGDTGKPKLAVRVGGLYVLEQIMDSSEAQHASILEVLCAYIRDNSLEPALKPSDGPRADIRVALTILGRRNRNLELSADRKMGLRLLKAVLLDREFLNSFTIEHVRPHLDLSGSDLSQADLSYLVFAGADFTGARLANCRALFADLNKAIFMNANLSGCVIASTIDGANLTGANLEGTTVSGRVSGVTFQNAQVDASIWIGAQFDNPRDIQAARGWESAFYNPRDLAALGLPPDHNIKLLNQIKALVPTASVENKIRLTLVLETLQKLTQSAQNARDSLLSTQAPAP